MNYYWISFSLEPIRCLRCCFSWFAFDIGFSSPCANARATRFLFDCTICHFISFQMKIYQLRAAYWHIYMWHRRMHIWFRMGEHDLLTDQMASAISWALAAIASGCRTAPVQPHRHLSLERIWIYVINQFWSTNAHERFSNQLLWNTRHFVCYGSTI